MLYLTTLLIGGDDETIAGRRISLELRGRGLDRIGAGIPIANENGRATITNCPTRSSSVMADTARWACAAGSSFFFGEGTSVRGNALVWEVWGVVVLPFDVDLANHPTCHP